MRTTTPPPDCDRAAPARADAPRAMRTTVAVFGVLLGLIGVEHGLGEVLQGSARPDGLIIESWPDSTAFEMVSGEPALTVVPNLVLTGILAIVAGLAVAVWSARLAGRRHGGLVLIALSLVLLLVGGGFGPPLIGVIVGIAATRIGAPASRPPSAAAVALARAWPWLVGAGVLGYLGLIPGTLLLSQFTAIRGDSIVLGLVVLAFGGLFGALVAGRARDRVGTGSRT
jgi:hypothetical protein